MSRSRTLQGFAKLVGGTSAAQAIVIGASPILTRLYTPDDMGVVATYMAVSSILITVAAGRYELAVMLAEDDDEAVRVAALALLLVASTAAATFVAVLVVYPMWMQGADSLLGGWVFLVPVTVLAGGISATFRAMATRRGSFGLIASTSVVRQAVGTTCQILLGLLKVAPGGLLIGSFLSVAAANLRLGRPVIKSIREIHPSRHEIRAVAARYSEFPRYTLPAGLLNSGYSQGLPLVIGWAFGAATLGLWSLASRTLALPSTIVGGAAAQTYYRSAALHRGNRRASLRVFDRTVLGLAIVSLPPFVVVAIWGPQLFGFVFGSDWAEAGKYAQLMIPLLWTQFVASPISRTFIVHERHRLGILLQALLVSALIGAVVIAKTMALGFDGFLLVFSVSTALVYGGLIPWARSVIARS